MPWEGGVPLTSSPIRRAFASALFALGLPCAALSAIDVADPLEIPAGAEPALLPAPATAEERVEHAIPYVIGSVARPGESGGEPVGSESLTIAVPALDDAIGEHGQCFTGLEQ